MTDPFIFAITLLAILVAGAVSGPVPLLLAIAFVFGVAAGLAL